VFSQRLKYLTPLSFGLGTLLPLLLYSKFLVRHELIVISRICIRPKTFECLNRHYCAYISPRTIKTRRTISRRSLFVRHCVWHFVCRRIWWHLVHVYILIREKDVGRNGHKFVIQNCGNCSAITFDGEQTKQGEKYEPYRRRIRRKMAALKRYPDNGTRNSS